ncbi:MAG: HlyD family efflux transporter periplasmic adaptor subunit [Candidatus Sumerlaeota bacterium]
MPETGPRAVAVMELKRGYPERERLLTGSVESWKQEAIGFEVPGRVSWIIDSGEVVSGDIYDAQGVLLDQGKLIARLDPTRYRQQVKGIEAKIEAARSKVDGLEVTLKEIVPQQIRQAESEFELAQETLRRIRNMYEDGAVAESRLDEARTGFETARAARERAIGRRSATEAERASAEADVRRLEEELESAKLDLEDTRLYAPFSGQVASTHAIPGSYVGAGIPVATMIVMDPLRVVVKVSARTDRRLEQGSRLKVHVPGMEEKLDGWVYVKDSVADPVTRTYEVQILVRNQRIPAGDVPEDAMGLPRVEELRRSQYRHPFAVDSDPGTRSLFVPVETLFSSAGKQYVLVAKSESGVESGPRVLKLQRVEVDPGQERVNVLGLYIYRILQENNGLTDDDLLVLNPPPDLREGGRAALVPERWLLRPGDIVDVEMEKREQKAGFYLPMDALHGDEGETKILYVVDPDGIARRMKVRVEGAAGTMQRVVGKDLREGMRVVTAGGAYLQAGERVRVVPEAQVLP